MTKLCVFFFLFNSLAANAHPSLVLRFILPHHTPKKRIILSLFLPPTHFATKLLLGLILPSSFYFPTHFLLVTIGTRKAHCFMTNSR